jgi:hypothetical protein
MNTVLQHIREPGAVLLTWQPSDESGAQRTRRVVGRLSIEGGEVSFRYLKGTADFERATSDGFRGYPAFRLEDKTQTVFMQGVMESFLRRLPPRNREDFGDYLKLHRLPNPFTYSDLALLGYTGAKLPSDGFALLPDFQLESAPCDFILEVAGFRHYRTSTTGLAVNDPVAFDLAPGNEVDVDAIAILHNGEVIGYVNRALRNVFRHWLTDRTVEARVERLNGKPERPLVYLYILVK